MVEEIASHLGLDGMELAVYYGGNWFAGLPAEQQEQAIQLMDLATGAGIHEPPVMCAAMAEDAR